MATESNNTDLLPFPSTKEFIGWLGFESHHKTAAQNVYTYHNFLFTSFGNTRQRARPGSKPKDYRQQCCSFCTLVHSRNRIVSSSLCWWWSSVYTGLALAISKCWTFTRASTHLTGAHTVPMFLVLYNKFTESSEPDSIILSHFLSASLNTTFRKHAPPVIFFQFCWRSRCHPLVSPWPAGWTRVKGKLKAIWVGQRSKSRGEEY